MFRTIIGGPGNDDIRELDTSDDLFLLGEGGDDTLVSSDGNDRLEGGDGNDELFGDDRDDTLIGGNGDDTLQGAFGNDRLEGGNGNDRLLALGDDSLFGGNGNDTLTSSSLGSSRLFGESGDDTLNGSFGNDFLSGGDGNDSLRGGFTFTFERNTLDGGSGNDLLDGSEGTDILIGGSGNDSLSGRFGNDTLIGGLGIDTLDGGFDDDTYILTKGSGYDLIPSFGVGQLSPTGFNILGTDTLTGPDPAGVVGRVEFSGSTASIYSFSGNDLLAVLGSSNNPVRNLNDLNLRHALDVDGDGRIIPSVDILNIFRAVAGSPQAVVPISGISVSQQEIVNRSLALESAGLLNVDGSSSTSVTTDVLNIFNALSGSPQAIVAPPGISQQSIVDAVNNLADALISI
ncbi:MAG: calcium-binding protein [Cyanobacteria bacterium J06642_2]